MASFTIPGIQDNDDGWGPSSGQVEGVIYAPFSKGDKVGKCADFYQTMQRGFTQNRFNQNYGASAPFNYRYEEEDDFQLVDTARTVNKSTFNRRKYTQPFVNKARQGGQQQRQFQQLPQRGRVGVQQRQQRPGQGQNQGRDGRYSRFNFDNKNKQKSREPSVDVRPEWQVVEQIDFQTLSKLSAEPPEAEDLETCGSMEYYNKAYDRITSKTERPLERQNRTIFKVSTTDDPIIRDLTMSGVGNIFATDAILAALMACPRSIYSWDLIVQRVGSKTFLDKRSNSQFDYLSVNETSNDPPTDESVNSPAALSQEATYINQNYSQQVLLKASKLKNLAKQNPFAAEGDDVAPVGYRYRRWALGNHVLVARTEVDAVLEDKGQDVYVLVKALNEYDPKSGIDWRKKIDTQRGAILATEIKNNSNKLTRWTAQALLAGAEQINIGFVSRVNAKDSYTHTILGTQFYKTKEFTSQINLNVKNMWGILKYLCEVFSKLPNGKYVLLKDPNKPLMRLYNVPSDAFEDLANTTETKANESSA
jgi:translation initiation factor 3 subunit D